MKKFLVFMMALVMSAVVFAHAALVSIDDIGGGKIYIEGGFSDGSSAGGMEFIIVKDKAYNGPEETFNGKEVIFKGKLDEKGSLELPKPATEKYEVIMNAGPGHVATKKGIALTEEEKAEWEKLVAEFDFGDYKESMMAK